MAKASRVRLHTPRRSRRSSVNYEFHNFIRATKEIGTEISIGILRDMANCEVFWDLVHRANELEDERQKVLSKLDELRARIAAPYKKKLAARKRNGKRS